jgi:orotate phosphoribosyltransferase
MALRRSFEVRAGERALITENVVTTGGSALEVADLLHAAGATVTGLATIIDRLPAGTRLPLPFGALARVDAAAWEPAQCPVCRAGLAAESPGSRRLPDRTK